MKKIITLGHPQSGYEQVEKLLLAAGMAPANPSQRDGLSPQHITHTLLKAHGVPPVEQVQGDEALAQIDVAPVWQGMVLDLMLSNLEQPLWGWADPQVIYLLDYWKAQDPQVVFVLVYDAPSTALTRLSLEEAAATPQQLQQRLQTWVAYNSALLAFYLRNPQRSVLVHAGQAVPSAKNYLQLVNTHIGGQSTALQLVAPEGVVPPSDDFANSQQAQMLLTHLLQTYPQAQALYEELQAAATLPGGDHLALNWDGSTEKQFLAWQEFVQLHQRLQAAQNIPKEVAEENELILLQLHQVQEELERYFIQNQELSGVQDELKKTQEALRAEKAQAAISKKELEEENELLLLQLHQVQEELERYYLENQRLKAGVTKPQAKSGQQASSANHYGAADRIKRQLSYRLGAVMIEKSRTLGGWLSMPFALQAEAKRFHQEKAARKGEKLPPIAHYRDAHEAERVKQHLSYRLGSTLVQRSGSLGGWLSMPCALRSQVKEFQKSRR